MLLCKLQVGCAVNLNSLPTLLQVLLGVARLRLTSQISLLMSKLGWPRLTPDATIVVFIS
jgi:hypothetical protein